MSKGDRLKHLRKGKDLSIGQVAKGSGLSKSYISQLELGKKANPTVEAIKKLEFVFGEDVRDIFLG